MAHKQKVPSRAPAGDLLLMLAMRGLEQGDAPHCARRRVSEANRRVAAALRPEMRRNQQSSGLLVSQRESPLPVSVVDLAQGGSRQGLRAYVGQERT